MNALERLNTRLMGETVDRIPNHCIIMGFGAELIGVSYRDFVSDYKLLCKAGIRCAEEFGIDVLSAISDPMRECEGLGAKVEYPENGVPYSPVPLIDDWSKLSALTVKDPSGCRRMNDRLCAVQRYSEYAAGRFPVQGWVEGAFAESCDLRDLNNMMTDIVLEPEAVKELLDIAEKQAIRFALAQINAGADIIGIGDAAASLIGPQMYEEFAQPYETRLIEAIHKAGAKAKLHICGDITPLLEDVIKTGADIVDCDWMVDFKRAGEVLGKAHSACGNFDPVAVLLQGTPETVMAATRKCIGESRPNSIIAAGCEVPPHTPPENLRAVADTLLQYQ